MLWVTTTLGVGMSYWSRVLGSCLVTRAVTFPCFGCDVVGHEAVDGPSILGREVEVR